MDGPGRKETESRGHALRDRASVRLWGDTGVVGGSPVAPPIILLGWQRHPCPAPTALVGAAPILNEFYVEGPVAAMQARQERAGPGET